MIALSPMANGNVGRRRDRVKTVDAGPKRELW